MHHQQLRIFSGTSSNPKLAPQILRSAWVWNWGRLS